MKTMPTKKEFPYNPIGSFALGNPFCIAFVYEKETSYIVKGGDIDVNKYLKSTPASKIVHKTYFRNGICWKWVLFINFKNRYSIFQQSHKVMINGKKRDVIQLEVKDHFGENNEWKTVCQMRRMPRKWISQLDAYAK